MSTVAIEYNSPRMLALRVTDDAIVPDLSDGRSVSVPLAWSWRLSDATQEQRNHYELIGSGLGAHWPELDEDISVAGMLHGVPARHPRMAEAA